MTSTLVNPAQPDGRVATIAVSGPLLGPAHVDDLCRTSDSAAAFAAIVIDLSQVTVINDQGLASLRLAAEAAIGRGQRVVFVCTELILRSELILADLDALAPVLDREEHATSLLAA
jgi:anti-anti-sigma regulatory factor